MGFIDKFLNVMNLNPEEDEESEYYDDYDDEYDEEPERAEKPAKRSFFSKKEKTPVEEVKDEKTIINNIIEEAKEKGNLTYGDLAAKLDSVDPSKIESNQIL